MKTHRFTLTPFWDAMSMWFILILCFLAACQLAPAQIIDKSDTCTVVVTKVVDGDTFYCAKDGDTAKVRVLGFDAYESSNGDRLDGQAARAGISVERALGLGVKAKEYAKELVEGQIVMLHRGNKRAPNREFYSLLLRYVVVNKRNFHELMISRGYAAPAKK
jgi:micrococcal nuclease